MAMTSRLENMRGSHGDLGSLKTLIECKYSKPEATSMIVHLGAPLATLS